MNSKVTAAVLALVLTGVAGCDQKASGPPKAEAPVADAAKTKAADDAAATASKVK